MPSNRFMMSCAIILAIMFFVFYVIQIGTAIYYEIYARGNYNNLIAGDFGVFWSAARIALTHDCSGVYSIDKIYNIMKGLYNRDFTPFPGFPYSPLYLLMLLPFGLLPFYVSLLLWYIILLCLFVYVIYKIAPKLSLVFFTLGFPGVFMNMLWGQNGFLTAILLGAFLLSSNNPILEGLFLSLLTYKPQFAFLPGIILLVTKKWKTLLWTVTFFATINMLSGLVFGFNIWKSFLGSIFTYKDFVLVDSWSSSNAIQVSLLSCLRNLSIEYSWAFAIQVLFILLVIIIACGAYIKTGVRMKEAILSISVLLATPYMMQYDLAILMIPLVLYGREIYQNGVGRYEVPMLILLWLMPLVNWPVVYYTGIQIAPICMIAFLIFAVRRATILYEKNI